MVVIITIFDSVSSQEAARVVLEIIEMKMRCELAWEVIGKIKGVLSNHFMLLAILVMLYLFWNCLNYIVVYII